MYKLIFASVLITQVSASSMAAWNTVATRGYAGFSLFFRHGETLQSAQESAMTACASTTCSILASSDRLCIAATLELHEGAPITGEGDTIQEAQADALAKCRGTSPNVDCVFAGYGCSTGAHIDLLRR